MSGGRLVNGAEPGRRKAILAVRCLALALVFVVFPGCARRPPSRESSASPVVVLYSSHPVELVRFIAAEFRDRSGMRLRIVSGGTGELLARLRAEVRAGRESGEQCDLFWGGGAESLAANAELFEPYTSSADGAIPRAYKAADRSWTGFTLLPMVIGYNSRLLPPSKAPRSWADLFKPSLAAAIAYADPAASGSSYTILRTLGSALAGPESEGGRRREVELRFAAAIHGPTFAGKLLGESASVFPSVVSGEYLVGLSYENAALDVVAAGSDLRIVYPVEGTSAVPDGVALARGGRNPAAARLFIDFALGLDVARVMAARFHRRSVRVDAPQPPGLPALADIKLLPYDIERAARLKEATLLAFGALFHAGGPTAEAARSRP